MVRNSHFPVKIRHSSRSAAIRFQSAANPAARRRRTNKPEAEAEDTAVNHRAQRLRVRHAASRPPYPLSLEATGPCIARIATAPEREKAAPDEEEIGADTDIAETNVAVTCSQPTAPALCDLHHTSMERMMLEEDTEEIRSYHRCGRRDCTRVFRDSVGNLDLIDGKFDDSRTSVRTYPRCGSILYLAEVDRSRKIETWECPQTQWDFSQDHPSPSAR